MWQFIEKDDTEVFVTQLEGNLIIAIAGTESARDWIRDLTLMSQRIEDWGTNNGIRIARDAIGVESTQGFLTHASRAYWAVNDAMAKWGLKYADVPRVWITGHSLGGAAARCLTLTRRYELSNCVTYGCPKHLHMMSQAPDRSKTTVSIRHYRDPVPLVPFRCKHGDHHKIITPSMRSRIPAFYLPFYLTFGFWSAARYLIGLGYSAHSLSQYRKDLTLFRS